MYQFANELYSQAPAMAMEDSPAIGPCDVIAVGMLVIAVGAGLTGLAIDGYIALSQKIETKNIAKAQAQAKAKESGPYSVKIQFQGPSIKGSSRTSGEGCVEVNLRSNKPIPASLVKEALTEKYAGLSPKAQAALAGAYEKVLEKIENASRNGGSGPDYKSYQSKTGKPGDRCDMLMTGDLNLVP